MMNSWTHRRLRSALLMAALPVGALLPAATDAAAQQEPVPGADPDVAKACRAPEHRQFDFWIGTWEVRDSAGAVVGRNEIRRVAGGCALLEDWRGASGSRGMSINAYEADRDRWTQRWVGAGAMLWLEGALEDGRMVLTGTSPRHTPRGEVLDRISWSRLPDGQVRQRWEVSSDQGRSWRTIFDGYYSRSR